MNYEWSLTLENLVEKHFADMDFNTTAMAEKLELSRSQLFRKVKDAKGISPSQYLQAYRLEKAYELFENKTYDSVKAVALSVGMPHRNSFASQFKAQYGKLPSEFLE
ncbi:MAG: helix-turn-helix domain-containing protein [Saprospiraceae bacterium]